LVLPSVVFRPARLLVVCAVLATVATIAAGMTGHLMFGAFFALGLALGLVNALLIRHSVQSITAEAHPLKTKMAVNSATRLLALSLIALLIAYLFRPLGLGVLIGLALFEVVLVSTSALPVVKKLRAQASASGVDGDRAEGTSDD
jgi:hypothetical protein